MEDLCGSVTNISACIGEGTLGEADKFDFSFPCIFDIDWVGIFSSSCKVLEREEGLVRSTWCSIFEGCECKL